MTNPEISIVIPCLNEEKNIQSLLEAILQQTVALNKLEVIISDGNSEDKTRQIISDFAERHPDLSIHVLDNLIRRIPAGLNQAIRAAKGPIICRMDAHAIPAPDYVQLSVDALRSECGDNIGGVIDIKPGADTWIGRAISIATAHPLGVGDAKYRWTKKAEEADTVAFGTFYKSKVEEVGYYNEKLFANEDYEFNSRLRSGGGKVWIDPAIRAVYFSRSTLSSLAKQYFFYGYWKVRMLRLYPKSLRWRQALPPIFVLGVLMLSLLAGFIPLAFSILWIGFGLYVLILLIAATQKACQHSDASLIAGIPLAIATMHFCWGSGFWWSLFTPEKKGN